VRWPTGPKRSSWPATSGPTSCSWTCAGSEQIHDALQQVLDDRAANDPAVQRHLIDAIAAEPAPRTLPRDGLTPREAEVLSLIAGGLSNTGMATRLVVSERRSRGTSTTCSPRSGPAPGPRPSRTPTGTGWARPDQRLSPPIEGEGRSIVEDLDDDFERRLRRRT
jgi:hypothetical protein